MQEQELINIIVKLDPNTKDWLFNRYCSKCGKFVYPEHAQCPKCPNANTINKPIPLGTSGTAIIKLINWYKNKYQNPQLLEIFKQWLENKQELNNQAILESIFNSLKGQV